MTFEKWAEDDLKKKVGLAGGKVIKMTPPAESGLPDDLVIMPGPCFWFVELKSYGKQQSKLQKAQADKLKRKTGCVVWVVDDEMTLDCFYNRIGIYDL